MNEPYRTEETDGITSDTGWLSPVPSWLLDTDVSDKAVRLYAVLGVFADRDGTNAYPSRRTLATKLRCSVDSVDRASRELVTAGALLVHKRFDDAGDRTSNAYTVVRTRPGGRADAATGGRTDETTGSRVDAAQPSSPSDSSPSNPKSARVEPSPLVLVESEVHVDPFDEFWSLYPNKRGKQAARRAFDAASRKTRFATIIDGVRRFAADANLPPERFIPHASTWLNGGRWEDPPLPPRNGQPFVHPSNRPKAGMIVDRDGPSRVMTDAEIFG